MIDENVMGEINLLLYNIPSNLNPIEKVRWLYIKLGEIFCYDYDYLDRQEGYSGINFEKDYVNRYESCIEISQILNIIFNNIDSRIKSSIIERKNSKIRGIGERNHICNLVTINDTEKYVMDLTLDLYNIQSGCKTREFGFSTINGDEDIISLKECEIIDKKLGLIKNNSYNDDKIDELSFDEMSKQYSSFDEMINSEISIINSLLISFKGYQEGKNYINKLLSRILRANRKEFNLKYNNSKMITCYMFISDSEEIWYIYDNNLGLVKTSPSIISNMLESGWKTKSNSLGDILEKGKIK